MRFEEIIDLGRIHSHYPLASQDMGLRGRTITHRTSVSLAFTKHEKIPAEHEKNIAFIGSAHCEYGLRYALWNELMDAPSRARMATEKGGYYR